MSALKFKYDTFETEEGQLIFVISQRFIQNFLYASAVCTEQMGAGWACYDDMAYVRHGFGTWNGEQFNTYWLCDNPGPNAFPVWCFSDKPMTQLYR